MAGGIHRGRWNKKSPVGTILILMCMIIPTLTSLEPQPSVEPKCPPGDFDNGEGICCQKCSPGFKLVEKCHAVGQRTECAACPAGQYTDQINYHGACKSCRQCKASKHEIEVSPCKSQQNTICRCKEGYYKDTIDSDTYQCLKCKQCGPDEVLKRQCTPESNTECGCKENYYRVKKTCEPCKNCSAECKHHCPSLPTMNTKAPDLTKDYLINILGGTAAVVVVSLVVVVIITHFVTKKSTKKKLLKSTSQTSEVSADSCKEVLIYSDGPSNNNSVNAALPSPVSEQEQPSNLPDCIPLEIKIPDLIYAVLDLVPVLKVKQLVRSLGVRDMEIEQAELDHRACREAHYQMLRVWAEGGSRAGGILHQPLLEQLLDELRKMHLERAAEELETKYSIQ